MQKRAAEMAESGKRGPCGSSGNIAGPRRCHKASTLDERYRDDPQLLVPYKKKLLEPGWAGELSRLEVDYIKDEFRRCQRLRVCWGFGSRAKRFPEAHIRAVARNW